MKCVITDYMGDDTVVEEADLRRAGIEPFVAPTKRLEDWIDEARDADAIMCRHAVIDAAVIGQLTRCRIIARYGIGFDNVDVDAARAAGVPVTNVPGFCVPEVAEHVIGLMLAVERGIGLFDSMIRSGGWQPSRLPEIRPLGGLRFGILGAGRIGIAVAERVKAFGMLVSAYDPYASIPDWISSVGSVDDLFSHADVVSLHVPLLDQTRSIVNSSLLSRMKPGSTLINCARGGLCDEAALVKALEDGTLRGVGLDTFVAEPLPPDSLLRRHPRAVCTPHVAYFSIRSLKEAKKSCVQEVIAVCSGKQPANLVY